jgi:hypothetical protein
MFYKDDTDEQTFIKCGALVLIVGILSLAIGLSLNDYRHKQFVKDAISAGYVEQPVINRNNVWVKPENYKPHVIDYEVRP